MFVAPDRRQLSELYPAHEHIKDRRGLGQLTLMETARGRRAEQGTGGWEQKGTYADPKK